jgi:hypothetical protein
VRAPFVGATVLYVPRATQAEFWRSAARPRAAIVADVRDGGRVDLAVIAPTEIIGPVIAESFVSFDAGGAPGTWHWPAS